jgi:hypothetical protein
VTTGPAISEWRFSCHGVVASALTELPAGVRAVAEACLAFSREYSGLHEADGQIQDLSQDGVGKSLDSLGGPPLTDPPDDPTAAGAEPAPRIRLSEHLEQLAARKAAEVLRMYELLRDACAEIAPGEPVAAVGRT